MLCECPLVTVTSARPVSKYLDRWQFVQFYANVRWSLSCRLGPSKEARPGPLARARERPGALASAYLRGLAPVTFPCPVPAAPGIA